MVRNAIICRNAILCIRHNFVVVDPLLLVPEIQSAGGGQSYNKHNYDIVSVIIITTTNNRKGVRRRQRLGGRRLLREVRGGLCVYIVYIYI